MFHTKNPALAALLAATLLGAAVDAQETGRRDLSVRASVFDDPRILEPEILRAYADAGALMRVIVNLAAPAEVRSFKAFRAKAAATSHRRRVADLQQGVLRALPPGEFTLGLRLENQATFSGAVTPRGLELLLAQPLVESVEVDHEVELATDQGITLMNGDAVRSLFDGTGVSIAIIDTGIDYGHVALGGGGFPNAKVIGGRDTADNDADPMDVNGHGTSVAGIAGGDVVISGDYVGGVAPGARLYGLKVMNSSGFIFNSYVTAALDWCVTHQDDDPVSPILVANASLGGGMYTSSCDAGSPAYATAASSVAAAGIAFFASSGNDGFCGAMGAPACVSNAISVGAVYDAAIGSTAFCVDAASCVAVANGGCTSGFACFDVGAAADQVTCYSNSASFLDILAPSNNARTPAVGGGYTSTFGGTSAASPYAAGAAAVLLHSALETGVLLTPAEVRTTLVVTGDDRTDSKSGITTPRVNLGNAVDSLGTYVDFAHVGAENGSAAQPWNTLAEGVAAVPVGGTLILKGNSSETPLVTKALTMRNRGGDVVIGE